MGTYELLYIHDLLKVPADRREDCVRNLLYALLLNELAFGEGAPGQSPGKMTWTDDGNSNVQLSANGKAVLDLVIEPKPAPEGERGM
jgi:hypothetical protein